MVLINKYWYFKKGINMIITSRSIKNSFIGLMIIVTFISVDSYAAADEINLMTQPNFPPYNFKKEKKLQGIAVDLIILMYAKSGSVLSRKDIRVVPWARGYKTVQSEKNTGLFSMTKTEERRNMFKWVGPIAPVNLTLFAKKKNNIKISFPDDIKKYKIGVIRNGFDEQFIVGMGIDKGKLDSAKDFFLNIRKLDAERFDIMPVDDNVMRWHLKEMRLNQADYEPVYVLTESELYYAFHKDTSDVFIQKLQKTLDKVKNNGEYQKIIDNYLK